MNNEQIFLTGEGHFDAAHNLVNYVGKCAQMHGHRWVVKAEFGPYTEVELDQAGIAVDFKAVKKVLNDVIDPFDHEYLNNFFERPSAELIALRIFRDMKQIIRASAELSATAKLYAVEVFESPESKCRVTHGS